MEAQRRCERWTVRHCLTAFRFTNAAHDWIVEHCKGVAQDDEDSEPPEKRPRTSDDDPETAPGKEHPDSYYQKIDGYKCDRSVVDACKKAVEGRGDGRVSKEDAETVFAKVKDGK